MIQPDEIIRSRRRTLSVSVDVFGRVIVRAPLRCGEERILRFAGKEGWIARRKSEAEASSVRLPSGNLDGYAFLLLGRECTVRLYDGANIRFSEGTGEIFCRRRIRKSG